MTRFTKIKEGMEEHLLSLKEVTNNQPENNMNRASWLWPAEGLQRFKGEVFLSGRKEVSLNCQSLKLNSLVKLI